MRFPALLLIVVGFALTSLAADTVASKGLFSVETSQLRSIEIEPLFLKTSFEVSADTPIKSLEADARRFKAMNGRHILDLSSRPEPPTRAMRLINALLPGGGVFGKNPNAPPGGFTR